MKKHLCTAICTVIFAALILTGCTGNKSTSAASGKDYTQQQTQGQIADAADRTKAPAESAAPSESVTEREGQTEKETEGQTVENEAQTDKKGGTMTEGEQQTKPQSPKNGTTTTTPETEAPKKTPVQSTPKPATPVSPEAPAETKAPVQTPKPEVPAATKAPAQTSKPVAPVQSETKAPAQTQKPSVPAETKAPAQTPKPTAPAQPETQAPTKAPEPPKKEKTMWDAPYDVEAIRDYIAKELISRGYTDVDDFEAYKKRVKELWNVDASIEDWKEMLEVGYTHPMNEWGSGAWNSETTATAGTPRYYDTANNCTVGHLHYKWAEPHTGGGVLRNEDGRLTLQTMVDDAINFWDVIYGHNAIGDDFNEGYDSEFFKIYIEKFDDGCVIFYIIM